MPTDITIARPSLGAIVRQRFRMRRVAPRGEGETLRGEGGADVQVTDRASQNHGGGAQTEKRRILKEALRTQELYRIC